MDIKAKINEIVDKIKSSPNLMKQFKSNPVKVIEGLIGIDLPDDQLKVVVDGVKAKMNLDSISDIAGKIGGIFGKK